jgi:hypothetical protein
MRGPDLPARLLPVADPAASVDPDLLSRIQAQRGRVSALLHSPSIAEGWLQFLTAVRRDSTLAPALRELVELTATIGACNLVSRFPVALRVGATGGKPAA